MFGSFKEVKKGYWGLLVGFVVNKSGSYQTFLRKILFHRDTQRARGSNYSCLLVQTCWF